MWPKGKEVKKDFAGNSNLSFGLLGCHLGKRMKFGGWKVQGRAQVPVEHPEVVAKLQLRLNRKP